MIFIIVLFRNPSYYYEGRTGDKERGEMDQGAKDTGELGDRETVRWCDVEGGKIEGEITDMVELSSLN